MANLNLDLAGMEPATLYTNLVQKGVKDTDAAILVGDWIIKTFGQGERHFAYTHPVPATDDCANTFQQQFQHQDWVDGVSVVQAGKSPGEDGFNDRMHRIQDDIAALSDEITKAVACIGELRQQVAAALDEVRVELNRLDHDVFALQQAANRGGRFGDTGIGGNVVFGTDTTPVVPTSSMVSKPAPISG